MSGEQVTVEVRCVVCGRTLGVYRGEVFYIAGRWTLEDARVVCSKCAKVSR